MHLEDLLVFGNSFNLKDKNHINFNEQDRQSQHKRMACYQLEARVTSRVAIENLQA